MYSQCPKCLKEEINKDDNPPAVGPGELPTDFGTVHGRAGGACSCCGLRPDDAGAAQYCVMTPTDILAIADKTVRSKGSPSGCKMEAYLSQWEIGRDFQFPQPNCWNMRYRMSFVVDPGRHVIPLQMCLDTCSMLETKNQTVEAAEWLKDPESL